MTRSKNRALAGFGLSLAADALFVESGGLSAVAKGVQSLARASTASFMVREMLAPGTLANAYRYLATQQLASGGYAAMKFTEMVAPGAAVDNALTADVPESLLSLIPIAGTLFVQLPAAIAACRP